MRVWKIFCTESAFLISFQVFRFGYLVGILEISRQTKISVNFSFFLVWKMCRVNPPIQVGILDIRLQNIHFWRFDHFNGHFGHQLTKFKSLFRAFLHTNFQLAFSTSFHPTPRADKATLLDISLFSTLIQVYYTMEKHYDKRSIILLEVRKTVLPFFIHRNFYSNSLLSENATVCLFRALDCPQKCILKR